MDVPLLAVFAGSGIFFVFFARRSQIFCKFAALIKKQCGQIWF